MIVKVDLPDHLVEQLYEGSRSQGLNPDQYVREMLYQLLSERSAAEDAKLENRPDWQEALARSKADREAGRFVPHKEVVDWHEGHPD